LIVRSDVPAAASPAIDAPVGLPRVDALSRSGNVPVSSACPVCDTRMRRWRHDWSFACTACGYLASDLTSHIDDGRSADVLDEEKRELALASLRRRNFERILDLVDSMTAPGRRSVLEVGCAHGWFLDAAAKRGYDVHGIEPDAPIGALASGKGHDVTTGFFPEALPLGVHFDVIVFNDVFEHLPDPRAALGACLRHLRPGGLLVLNLPSSRGALFRLAALFDRIGFSGPFERMWQKGFPSPHLSYFHPDALTRLAQREGFAEIYRGELDTLDRRGLWQRVRLDRRSSLPGATLAWLGVTAVMPLSGVLASDIALQIYKPAGARASSKP
jgi:SAM-dependent methyltransferase